MAVLGDQDVTRLEVTMDDAVVMQELFAKIPGVGWVPSVQVARMKEGWVRWAEDKR